MPVKRNTVLSQVSVPGQHEIKLTRVFKPTLGARYAVTYGMQTKTFATLEDAANDVAACMMHAMQCNGEQD